MSLLETPDGTERLELGPEDKRRIYLFRLPTTMEKIAYRRDVAAMGGRRHTPFELLGVLRRAVERLMADSPAELRDANVGKIEAQRVRILALASAAENPSVTEVDVMAQLREINDADGDLAALSAAAREGDAKYAAFETDALLYPSIAAVAGLHRFLIGWEGFEPPLERVPTRIGDPVTSKTCLSEASLSEIRDWDYPRIAQAIENMLGVTDSTRKKLRSLSPTPSDASISSH